MTVEKEEQTMEELNLTNGVLFVSTMEDEELCKEALETMLERKIGKVTVHVEHTLFYRPALRSVRLDVYATDEAGEEFDVEMQCGDKAKLPKRSRLYQAEMDVSALKRGSDFEELTPSYVIFICDFDPFDKGLYRYTFENRCVEADFPLGDEAVKIFFNLRGKNPESISPELKELFDFMKDSSEERASKSGAELVKKLNNKVQFLKKDRDWRSRYMTVGDLIKEAEEAARKEGRKAGVIEGHCTGIVEGKSCIAVLISKMTEAGEGDKLSQLSDPAFQEAMLRKYNL